MKELWQYHLFSIAEQSITVGRAVIAVVAIAFLFAAYRSILKKFFPKVFLGTEISSTESKIVTSLLRGLVILIFIIAIVLALNQNRVIYKFASFDLTVLLVLKALVFIQIVRLSDWFVSNVFIHNYYASRQGNKNSDNNQNSNSEMSARRLVQSIFYVVVLLYALNNFQIDFTLFSRELSGNIVEFKFSNIVYAILIVLIARLLIWGVTNVFLHNIYLRQQIDLGSQYAVNQIIKYIVYIMAIIMCFNVLGIDMNLILGGAAALLVGIGLGLQQTFNDFISGIVILFERSVSVGDVLEIEDTVGTVKKIGLRASTLETRSNISMVVPNHLLVNEKVINWNHYNDKVRFEIQIGVAYGSDTILIKKLLVEAVKENPYVVNFPAPFVRFQSFGESSLDFSLYFFSRNYMVIEDIKSDIRLEIDRLFRENNVSIPFPQSEIRIKRD